MTTTTIPYRFLVRGGTAAAIAALNEVPKAREIIYETDTRKWKVGDGVTAYNSLAYYGSNLWQPLHAFLTRLAALGDPNADRLIFWDDSAGQFEYLTLGTNLSITGTTINATSGGGSSLIGSTTVAGAATGTITVSGLDLATHKRYEVRIYAQNDTASDGYLYLYANADTTAGNYDAQLFVSGSGSSSYVNNGNVAHLYASTYTEGLVEMVVGLDGKPSAFWKAREGARSSAMAYRHGAWGWRTAANVTSLSVVSAVANAFAIGSKVEVWSL